MLNLESNLSLYSNKGLEPSHVYFVYELPSKTSVTSHANFLFPFFFLIHLTCNLTILCYMHVCKLPQILSKTKQVISKNMNEWMNDFSIRELKIQMFITALRIIYKYLFEELCQPCSQSYGSDFLAPGVLILEVTDSPGVLWTEFRESIHLKW